MSVELATSSVNPIPGLVHIPQVRDFSGPREFFHQGPSDVAKYQENQRCCDWVQTDHHQAIYGEDDRRDAGSQVKEALLDLLWFVAMIPHTASHLFEVRLFAHAATVPQISIL